METVIFTFSKTKLKIECLDNRFSLTYPTLLYGKYSVNLKIIKKYIDYLRDVVLVKNTPEIQPKCQNTENFTLYEYRNSNIESGIFPSCTYVCISYKDDPSKLTFEAGRVAACGNVHICSKSF